MVCPMPDPRALCVRHRMFKLQTLVLSHMPRQPLVSPERSSEAAETTRAKNIDNASPVLHMGVLHV
jgi:hypothetical protein